MIIFFAIAFFHIASAQYFNEGYAPVNVNGYVTNVDTRTPKDFAEEKLQTRQGTKQNIRYINPNLARIQEMYPNASYSDIILPDEEARENKLRGYKTTNSATPMPVQITTESMHNLCNDLGFNQDTERNSLKFYECVTEAMKTKFTEETRQNKEFHQMDANIVKALESKTAVDSIVHNLTQYQDLLSQQNKMDCLNEDDYYKCVKHIVEYKQCQNASIEEIKHEHNNNKVICYVKTAIRFPNPSGDDISVRNSYYSVCNHLIQSTLKKQISENNTKCNQILTKNNLLHLTI